MKKLIAITSLTALSMILRSKTAHGWFGATHEDFTNKALELIEKDGKIKQFGFFKKYQEIIISGSTEPDKENDVDSGTGLHYYVLGNPKGKDLKDTNTYYNNSLGKFSKSARTYLEENYTCSLLLYKSGKLDE